MNNWWVMSRLKSIIFFQLVEKRQKSSKINKKFLDVEKMKKF
jgi:hypothetical protein